MPSTSFTDDVTIIYAEWLNEVNTLLWGVFNGSSTPAEARTAIGLVIGSDVQGYDATLQSLAALGTGADKLAYSTGVDTWTETTITAFARQLLDDTTAASMRTTLGLVIGTDVQGIDATLTSLAGLGTAADKLAYTTGIDTWAETPLTAYARTLLDDADAAAARTTLGLGTLAVQNTADNDHLYLGTGNDLDLYHSGTESYLVNNTGNLNINQEVTSGSIFVRANDYLGVPQTGFNVRSSGTSVRGELWHNGSGGGYATAGGLYADAFAGGVQSLGTTGATAAVNCLSGQNVYAELGANTQFQLSNITQVGGNFTLRFWLAQDATGSRVPSWSSTVHWPGGVTPTWTTTPNKMDIVEISNYGSVFWGRVIGLNYTEV